VYNLNYAPKLWAYKAGDKLHLGYANERYPVPLMYFAGSLGDLPTSNSSVSYDITTGALAKANRLPGGTYRLLLQGGNIDQSSNQLTLSLAPATVASLLGSYFHPEDGDDFPPERRPTFTALDDVPSRKMRHFIATSLK
jgi:hypothetical protein